MKRWFVLVLLLLAYSGMMQADTQQRKLVKKYNRLTHTWITAALTSIHDIQYVTPDSLHVADSLQKVVSRYLCQASPLLGDTVVVHAVVIAPKGVITYTQHGWSMVLHETIPVSQPWSGIFARIGSTGGVPDTAAALSDGFADVARGDVVEITCRVEEFPGPADSGPKMGTVTQLRPIPGVHVDIVGTYPIPQAAVLPLSSFYHGVYPGGTIDFSTGEQWEGCLVKFKNVTVSDIINSTRGTYDMVDDFGNTVSDYDVSYYFSFTSSETPPTVPDTSITHFHFPPAGATIDSIQGFMMSASGQENDRGQRICPIYYGDVVFGITKPRLFQHRRYPVVVENLDSVEINVKVNALAGGYPMYKTVLLYSLNYGPWIADTMNMVTLDSTYQAYILDPDGNGFGTGTQVRYFLKALDIQLNQSILANATATSFDTSTGFFFYNVVGSANSMTVHDVQYTPYKNGRSAYVGAAVTVRGVVTADSLDIVPTNANSGGTTSWYIQSGNAPWSGIWVVPATDAARAQLDGVRRGDSVAVYGLIQENFSVTRISDSSVTVLATGRPVPAPVLISDTTIGARGDGDRVAEQYEGMLVRMLGTHVSSDSATYSDRTEFSITGNSGQLTLCRTDGISHWTNNYADTTLGKRKVLQNGDPIDTITGVLHFSFSQYKLIPRQDDDIVAGDLYQYSTGWNMISIARDFLGDSATDPNIYGVHKLYPTSTSQAFYYAGSYFPASTIGQKTGYWLKFGSASKVRQLGFRHLVDSISVNTGWNLIGCIDQDIATSTITTEPTDMVLSSFFKFAGSYSPTTTLSPGYAYWVKCSKPGIIIEGAPSLMLPKQQPAADLNRFNTLTIADRNGNSQTLYFGMDAEGSIRTADYEMPPSAPEAGTFDARFASNRILETYPEALPKGAEYGLNITALKAPVTVSWNITNGGNNRFTLTDDQEGKIFKSREISGTGNTTVQNSGNFRMNLKVAGGAAKPKEFALSQNYPNPFNPSTKFVVSLPQTAHLEVAVYNILGQKVATLANEVREAGYHTITWNGTSDSRVQISSGIYFVRMQAEKFTAVRKIMMMK